QESLMAANFAGLKTNFLVNKYIIPIPLQKNLVEEDKSSSSPFATARVSEKELLNQLKRIGKDVFLVPATEICQKELGTNVVAGIYLISLAAFKKLIPIRPDSILKAMKKIIPKEYLELNLKAFNLALNQ
ncbi:MAG: 2-oxoacid:acceptor oxidoreductase family protein, partial [bacterium]|nr:2-oxoacid:acceptor oxidoreductase family protein [bacterium]